jgi:transposase InsO family protein
MACTGGRAPKLPVLALQGLHFGSHVRSQTRLVPAVDLGLLHPLIECLRRAADLGRDRHHRCPVRHVIAFVIPDHPTGSAFTGVLANSGIAISMDGKGAWRDNVFVERLWRSVKYEEVYLRAYEGVSDARASIGRYLDFYNGRRPHSSLDGMTPDQAYFTPLPLRLAA